MSQIIKTGDFRTLLEKTILKGPVLAAVGALLITIAVVLGNMRIQHTGIFDDLEAGKVADRDIIAEYSANYVDSNATRLRQDALEQETPAVFVYSEVETQKILEKWDRFVVLAGSLYAERVSVHNFVERMQDNFPGFFPVLLLEDIYRIADRDNFLTQASSVLNEIIEMGVFSVPVNDLEGLNQDVVELVRGSVSRNYSERIPFSALVTHDTFRENIDRLTALDSFSQELKNYGKYLLEPFISENVSYSPEETKKRILENRRGAEPVLKYIEKGEKIIKKGFIVSEENMEELRAFMLYMPSGDNSTIASYIILLLLIFAILYYYCSHGLIGRKLSPAETYMISIISAAYLCGTVLLSGINFGADSSYAALIMPTALVIMLPAVLISLRLAIVLALLLPLGAFFIGSYDYYSFIFAVMSGITAAYATRKAGKRMDLLKAGLIVTLVNCVVMVAGLLGRRSSLNMYPASLFFASFNGIASGMLVLGFLPALEQLLNTATPFRLIELSDLNAPVLRRLFAAAPGTYSHSIMVANLAEAACQDIGANALLARVGSYYHDMGKMDNPDYFIENQTNYNRHDNMEPRHSIYVIRGHVTRGLENGRQLRLPAKVLEIIGEHHGNSVIAWFYNKALEQEGQVPIEDFSYPGNPPRSRESAVVMLADTVEAAVRTLEKPTPAELEDFIKKLFNAKLEHGQLSRAELTFSELETVRNTFIRVLHGYYHTRIEYPKLPADADHPAVEKAAEAAPKKRPKAAKK
ncbi:MAG: HDIG domain-containing protein [Treponema sp.]|jgi:putative nucleotidyltransferase with HDIG domain|nr:HDIG domain-containing protein [Treponema sp.]